MSRWSHGSGKRAEEGLLRPGEKPLSVLRCANSQWRRLKQAQERLRACLLPNASLNDAHWRSKALQSAVDFVHRTRAVASWDRVSAVSELCERGPGGKPGGANPARAPERRSRRKSNRYHIADRPYWVLEVAAGTRASFCTRLIRHANFSDSDEFPPQCLC